MMVYLYVFFVSGRKSMDSGTENVCRQVGVHTQVRRTRGLPDLPHGEHTLVSAPERIPPTDMFPIEHAPHKLYTAQLMHSTKHTRYKACNLQSIHPTNAVPHIACTPQTLYHTTYALHKAYTLQSMHPTKYAPHKLNTTQ